MPENVFEEFYQGIYALADSNIGMRMGWDFAWMTDVAFQEFACDIIPTRGEFLLCFPMKMQDASMILIYSPAAERISGFSLPILTLQFFLHFLRTLCIFRCENGTDGMKRFRQSFFFRDTPGGRPLCCTSGHPTGNGHRAAVSRDERGIAVIG